MIRSLLLSSSSSSSPTTRRKIIFSLRGVPCHDSSSSSSSFLTKCHNRTAAATTTRGRRQISGHINCILQQQQQQDPPCTNCMSTIFSSGMIRRMNTSLTDTFSNGRIKYVNDENRERYRHFSTTETVATSTESAAAAAAKSNDTSEATKTVGTGSPKIGSDKSTTSKNSYLVVNLEKKVLKDICDNVQSIQTKFKAAVEHPRIAMEKQYGKTNLIDDINQPLQIKLRHLEALELVLFSGGTALNTVPADVLQRFYDKAVDRLDRAGLALHTATKLKDGNMAHPDDYWFRANEFKLFPPTTKHLLVVTFQTSVAWMCVYEDIQLVANKFPQLPHRPLEQNQILRWLPLIVVADVSGGTGRYMKERNIIQNLVDDWPMDCTSNHQTVCMGGTIPKQVPNLDWNFHDKLRQRPTNESELLNEIKMGKEFWKPSQNQTS